jgi:predicted MPP superfamily phosphohydrolase
MGNHERYGDLDRIAALMAETGVVMLRNEVVEYKGVQLVGADYPERENQKDTPYLRELKVKKGLPSVLMYHPPTGIEYTVQAGIDLQVSGHTHNGQLFPFNLLAKLFFPYIKGLYQIDGMYLYVSPGTGTWGPPMRLGSHNEITLFNLVPG